MCYHRVFILQFEKRNGWESDNIIQNVYTENYQFYEAF